MTTHKLKLDIKYFYDVKKGVKNFVIRNNDRDFQADDILELRKRSLLTRSEVPIRFAISTMPGLKLRETYLDQYDNPCVESKAEIIRAKVNGIMIADDYNSYAESKKPSQFAQTHEVERGGHWFNFFKIDKALKAYFRTDKLPEGYVVMGIEVIE